LIKAPTPGSPARRRPSGELSELILDAARELFASKGYAGTSSREIAERAGAYEPSIYRRFGSKAKLFEAAVVAPLNEAISTYHEAWERLTENAETTEELIRPFIEPLYDLLTDHRELVLALISAQEFHGDLMEGAGRWTLDAVLQRVEPQTEMETLRRNLSVDPYIIIRVAAGLVMGVALLDPLLFPDGAHKPTREQILEEMVRVFTYGVEPRPEPGSAQHRLRTTKRRSAPVSPELAQVLDRLADAERRAVRAELELERLRKEMREPSGNVGALHAVDDATKRRRPSRPPQRREGA
jgi:AcrR family transcriptional regulator